MSPLDYPNLEVLGLDPPWVEGTGGTEAAPKRSAKEEPAKLPGQHAGLAEKQAELESA
jgi:hypothetical protein